MRRREFLATSALLTAGLQAQAPPTRFQLACMTLPYSAFPWKRALTGIKAAGFAYVAWGVTHREPSGAVKPVLAVEDSVQRAAELATRCHGMGLEPVMMFSTVHLEAANARDAHLRRIEQAAAARIPFLLTFGKTSTGIPTCSFSVVSMASACARSCLTCSCQYCSRSLSRWYDTERFFEAAALLLVLPMAMWPSVTRPAFWHKRRTCTNNPARAAR